MSIMIKKRFLSIKSSSAFSNPTKLTQHKISVKTLQASEDTQTKKHRNKSAISSLVKQWKYFRQKKVFNSFFPKTKKGSPMEKYSKTNQKIFSSTKWTKMNQKQSKGQNLIEKIIKINQMHRSQKIENGSKINEKHEAL